MFVYFIPQLYWRFCQTPHDFSCDFPPRADPNQPNILILLKVFRFGRKTIAYLASGIEFIQKKDLV